MPAASPLFAVCLFGPTGTGKTDVALRLAGEFPLEIVSVDSAMVYRYMDVGTAKPDPAVRRSVPHHLIDVLDPWESYSAGRFREDASRLIADIQGRGNVPLLTGGTMLYFRALMRGLSPLPQGDRATRERIDLEAELHGWAALHARLMKVDPAAAARIKPTDRQRIQRALEVFRLTGSPISTLQRQTDADCGIRFLRIALMPGDRAALYRRLDARFHEMLGNGLVNEVATLRRMPPMKLDCPALRAVGYRQIWKHLCGEFTLQEAERQALAATHQLAKRQFTWLRAEPVDLVIDPQASDAAGLVGEALAVAGVSRRARRCNMMVGPLECREHGV